MKYVDRVLQPGEAVVYVTRFHWLIFGRAALFLLIAIGFLVGATQAQGNSSVALEVVAAIFALLGINAWISAAIRRATTEFAVTDRRVIYKRGLIWRSTIEIDRSKVESVFVNQSIVGRIFGFGTIILRGTGGTYEPVPFIREPLAFRSHITPT